MGAKLAWFQEKYSGRTHGGIGCSSSQANCPLTEKELHQICMDEEALKELLEEEDAGLPSEKVMSFGKNADDGDLLLFRLALAQVIGLPERLVSQFFLEWNVPWRLPVPGSCQIRCIARFEWLCILCLEDMSRSVGFKHWAGVTLYVLSFFS
ncbi:hypothetical protein Tco_0221297 [Tanacetum coccineum]